MNHWNWRECPYLMPDSLHSYKQEGMAYPGDPSEDHLRYDGCSLNLLKAPDNSCHYVACYGKDNNVEAPTNCIG